MSSVVLLDIWSYILSMIPVARIPTQHSPQEVWLKVWGRVCVYVSLCVSLVLDLCVSLVLEGSNKTFTWYDMFFTSKKNLDISPFIITFLAKILRGQPLDPGLTAEIQPTAVEVWQLGLVVEVAGVHRSTQTRIAHPPVPTNHWLIFAMRLLYYMKNRPRITWVSTFGKLWQ